MQKNFNHLHFIWQVKNMREAQNKYFGNRTSTNLAASKRLEKLVDELIKQFPGEEPKTTEQSTIKF